MNVGVTPLANLVGMPDVAGLYRAKTAGCAMLLEAQAAAPFEYMVPPAFAIPPRETGSCEKKDIRKVFDAFTEGREGTVLLMARSSHGNESPGKYDSPIIPYSSPEFFAKTQKFLRFGRYEKGFRRFNQVINAMCADPGMGVLAMMHVAGLQPKPYKRDFEGAYYREPERFLGGQLVSFVANTHSLTKPSEIELNVVQGLGTRAVEGNDSVLIRADRATGLLTFWGVMSDYSTLGEGTSAYEIPTLGDYRQKVIDVYDTESEGIVHFTWEEFFAQGLKLCLNITEADMLKLFDWYNFQMEPFGCEGMYRIIIGLLQYFANRFGPCQIEGAYLERERTKPLYLYQLLRIPERPTVARPLEPFKPHITTDEVLGIGTFHGPLIFYEEGPEMVPFLKGLDKRFAGSGYIFLTRHNMREIILATPHCRCRLSLGAEEMVGHAKMDMGFKIASNPSAGYVFGKNVRLELVDPKHDPMSQWTIAGKRPAEADRFHAIFPNARLDSNGEEFVVEIL